MTRVEFKRKRDEEGLYCFGNEKGTEARTYAFKLSWNRGEAACGRKCVPGQVSTWPRRVV